VTQGPLPKVVRQQWQQAPGQGQGQGRFEQGDVCLLGQMAVQLCSHACIIQREANTWSYNPS
jgi:hypothetical protein